VLKNIDLRKVTARNQPGLSVRLELTFYARRRINKSEPHAFQSRLKDERKRDFLYDQRA